MITKILSQLPGLLIGAMLAIGAVKLTAPKIEIPKCPDCNCPPATEIKMQELDMKELKKIRGDFNYSPSISNVTMKIESKDSLMLKELIRQAK